MVTGDCEALATHAATTTITNLGSSTDVSAEGEYSCTAQDVTNDKCGPNADSLLPNEMIELTFKHTFTTSGTYKVCYRNEPNPICGEKFFNGTSSIIDVSPPCTYPTRFNTFAKNNIACASQTTAAACTAITGCKCLKSDSSEIADCSPSGDAADFHSCSGGPQADILDVFPVVEADSTNYCASLAPGTDDAAEELLCVGDCKWDATATPSKCIPKEHCTSTSCSASDTTFSITATDSYAIAFPVDSSNDDKKGHIDPQSGTTGGVATLVRCSSPFTESSCSCATARPRSVVDGAFQWSYVDSRNHSDLQKVDASNNVVADDTLMDGSAAASAAIVAAMGAPGLYSVCFNGFRDAVCISHGDKHVGNVKVETKVPSIDPFCSAFTTAACATSTYETSRAAGDCEVVGDRCMSKCSSKQSEADCTASGWLNSCSWDADTGECQHRLKTMTVGKTNDLWLSQGGGMNTKPSGDCVKIVRQRTRRLAGQAPYDLMGDEVCEMIPAENGQSSCDLVTFGK